MAVVNQSNQNSVTTGTTCSVTLASPVTTGSVIVCCTTGDGTSLTMSDSTLNAANTYFSAVSGHIFYVMNAVGGSTTFTVTSATAVTYQELIVTEFNQLNAGGGFDKAGAAASGTGTTATSASITTAVANELVVGYLDGSGGGAAGTGYTLVENAIDLVEYKVQATATATTATCTQSNGPWFMYVAAWKPMVIPTKHYLGMLGCGS